MVRAVIQKKHEIYACEECGLIYAIQEIAKKCEAWCRAHKSCNLDIIKNVLPEDLGAEDISPSKP